MSGGKALMVVPSSEEDMSPDALAKKASLAENAVKAVANGDTVKVRKPRKRARARVQAKPKPSTKVTKEAPIPELWEAAKALAKGNHKLLLPVSDGVIIMNHPGQFDRPKREKAGK